MRVRVNYTVTVSDEYRRAINLYYGRPGLATRTEVKRWLEQHGSAEDDDLMHDLRQAIERGDERAS
jgi:hypothetical protein